MLRRLIDLLIGALCRVVARAYFREVEVVGAERVPRGRRIVFVANHVNGLVDPLLMLGFVPARVRFLSKHTLWDHWFLRLLLNFAGVLPVYRRMDSGGDATKNAQTFARCHEALARGDAIAMFPEGISHDEPELQPLRTGAARIVLEAPRDASGTEVLLVPVGLTFTGKERFRSRALVVIGEPLDPAPERALVDGAENADAVRTLTARVDEALRGVTLNYPSWEEAQLLERAADLVVRGGGDSAATRVGLKARFATRHAFASGYAALREREPERVAGAAQAVARYDRLLAAFRLTDGQVAGDYRFGRAMRFLAGTLVPIVLGAPLAALGTALNVLPYHTAGWYAAAGGSRRPREDVSSHRLFGALFFYPVFWLAQAAALGWLGVVFGVASGVTGGALVAGLALVATPLTGLVALGFHERRGHIREQSRVFFALRGRGRLANEVRRCRAEALETVEALVRLAREFERAEVVPATLEV